MCVEEKKKEEKIRKAPFFSVSHFKNCKFFRSGRRCLWASEMDRWEVSLGVETTEMVLLMAWTPANKWLGWFFWGGRQGRSNHFKPVLQLAKFKDTTMLLVTSKTSEWDHWTSTWWQQISRLQYISIAMSRKGSTKTHCPVRLSGIRR